MPTVPQYRNYIAGRFATSREMLEMKNPSTQETIALVPHSSESEVEEAVDAAKSAQGAWNQTSPQDRANYLRKIAQGIRRRSERIARTISEEQGKTLPLSRIEVEFTASYMEYMAEWARRIEGEIISSDRPNENIFLFRKAMGVVAGILPWNFPFFLIARKAAPALITGNTIVIKPSEDTSVNACEFSEIVSEEGLPHGVFNLVCGRGSTAGLALSRNRRIAMISFTGSVETGSRIMAEAAKNIVKVNLELGGKAPAIVMADADLDLAVEALWQSRVINSGQVCNCAERIYVQEEILEVFTKKITERMRNTRYGNPLVDSNIDYGPLTNRQGLEKVERLVETALKAGAKAETGGRRGDNGAGFFYEPTVLSHCTHEMEIMREEIFGPVMPIAAFRNLDEAISSANDSPYGLTSSIYTTNLNTAMKACRNLEFGETYVNREHFEGMQGFHAGWRKSGIGGADGRHGVLEYTQTQVVYLQY